MRELFMEFLVSVLYNFTIGFGLCILMGGFFKFVYNFSTRVCDSNQLLIGKSVLITGATSGIGKVAALNLAKKGARILLACRNLAKAQKTADEIRSLSGNNNISIYELDTSQLQSVRKCAKEILRSEVKLDIMGEANSCLKCGKRPRPVDLRLINNAGTAAPTKRKLTDDGLEVVMATNHYGHFLLTNLLLGLLKKSSPSRIINVSSSAHRNCTKLDPEDLNFEKQTFSHFKSYSQSKLCNILFTMQLSKILIGTGVTANSLHPGLVSTEFFEKMDSYYMKVLKYFIPLVAKTPERGAQTIIYLAVSDEVKDVTGKYFENCKITDPSALASHGGFAKKLWLASELDVKLDNREIFY